MTQAQASGPRTAGGVAETARSQNPVQLLQASRPRPSGFDSTAYLQRNPPCHDKVGMRLIQRSSIEAG